MSDISLGTIYGTVELRISDVSEGADEAKKIVGDLRDTMKMQLGAAADFTGAAMQRAGEAILGGLGKAVEAAGSYDQALRDVSAVNKLTEAQFGELHDSILELAKDPLIKDTPELLAKGMYRIASAGFEGKKGLEVLKVSAEGATAGMTDTQTASLALIAALKSYPEGTYTARQAMDLLVGEVDLGVNTFKEFATSIGRVLPIASIAHVGLDEVAAAVATLTRGGLSAGEAITALTQFIKHIVEPSKGAQKVMNALGIEWGAGAIKAHGLGGMIQMVADKTHGNADAMARAFPELRSLTGGMVLARQRGAEYAEVLEKERAKTQGLGATTQVATEQSKGYELQQRQLAKEINGLAIKIGEDLLPTMRDLLKDVKAGVDWFSKLPPETRKNIVEFAALSGVILTVGGSLLRLVGFAVRARAALAGLGIEMSGVIKLAKGIAALPAAGPVGLLGGGFAALKAYMDAGFTVHAPPHGETNIPGGQVNVLERRRFLTGEIAKLERSISSAQTSGITVAPSIMARNQQDLARLRGELTALPKATAAASHKSAKGVANAWAQAGADSGDAYIKNLLKKLDDGGKSGRAAAKAAKQAAKDAKEIADQIQEARDATFENTHSDTETQLRQAKKEYQDRVSYDPDNLDLKKAALDEYLSKVKKINAEAKQQQIQDAQELVDKISDMWQEAADEERDQETERKDAQKEALKDWLDNLAEQGQAAKEAAKEAADDAREKAREQADAAKEWAQEYKDYVKEMADDSKQMWDEISQKSKDGTDKEKRTWKQVLGEMRDQAKQTLSDDLGNALTHGFKGFFKEILQQFEEMLAQMAAKAIVSGIFSLFSGGLGGLFGGGGKGDSGGLMSMFGFDDGANDATAKRWGWDFASMFSRGASDYVGQRQPGRAALAGVGADGSHMTINMYGDQHYYNDQDAHHVADTIAWHAQNRLVVSRAPKG